MITVTGHYSIELQGIKPKQLPLPAVKQKMLKVVKIVEKIPVLEVFIGHLLSKLRQSGILEHSFH